MWYLIEHPTYVDLSWHILFNKPLGQKVIDEFTLNYKRNTITNLSCSLHTLGLISRKFVSLTFIFRPTEYDKYVVLRAKYYTSYTEVWKLGRQNRLFNETHYSTSNFVYDMRYVRNLTVINNPCHDVKYK